jgi:ribosomal protein S18 acetylase RimI-like enzyme
VSDSGLEWVASAALGREELRQAARWIRSMDEDYYNLFALDDETLESFLGRMTSIAESEFGTTLFARKAGALAGFVTPFAAEETFARRIFILKGLLAAAPDPDAARQRLRTFDGAARTVPAGAFYLAKLYVASPLRGTGLSNQMFGRFIEEGTGLGRKLCLHVRRDNAVALAFYHKHGFTVNQDPSLSSATHWLMENE